MARVARMSWSWLLGAWLLVMLPACATPTASEAEPPGALNRTALRASRPRFIALVKARHPTFDGNTGEGIVPGAVVGGVVGAALGAGLSPDYTSEMLRYRLEDPATAIRRSILGRMVRRFGLSVVSEAEAAGEDGAPVATDLFLAVDTESWGLIPTRLGHYGVKYRGSLRLTDNRTHQILAEGTCTSRRVDSADTPTIDELRANEGALMKSLLAATAEYCIDDYRKRLLGLY